MVKQLFCVDCGKDQRFIKHWMEDITHEFEEICTPSGIPVRARNRWVPTFTYDGGNREFSTQYHCESCGNDQVDKLSEDQIFKTKCLHTDKEGEWHSKELPIEERNDELMAALTARGI